MNARKRTAGTPKTANEKRYYRPRTLTLSDATVLKARRVVLDLTEKGVETSLSGLCELALLELLGRRDLADLLRRSKAGARRGSTTAD
jgi:hypothetical protein